MFILKPVIQSFDLSNTPPLSLFEIIDVAMCFNRIILKPLSVFQMVKEDSLNSFCAQM
jgi:hypothetical protein